MAEGVAGQQFEPGAHVGVAATSAGPAAMPVVRVAVTVQADPHAYVQVVEQPQERGLEPDGVGLEADVDLGIGADRGPDGVDHVRETLSAGEKGLTAVENEGDPTQLVPVDVLGDTAGDLVDDRARHASWTGPPALVCHFVHVAVVAGEIAATVDLEDELTEGGGPPSASEQIGDVKTERPLLIGTRNLRPEVHRHP